MTPIFSPEIWRSTTLLIYNSTTTRARPAMVKILVSAGSVGRPAGRVDHRCTPFSLVNGCRCRTAFGLHLINCIGAVVDQQ